jgi:peptide/nickel transport system permease protein
VKILRDLFRDYRFALSFSVLVVLLILSGITVFYRGDPSLTGAVPRDLPPSAKYLLGTDSKGQEIFWQATFAIRNSLIVSVIAALISRVIAILVGMIAGYTGGMTDRVLMFISDSLLVIPLFLILVMMAMLVREHMTMLILALLLAAFGWAWDARVIRSLILSLR